MEKEKVAVSGVNGFVGNHLAQELGNAGLSVIGIDLGPKPNAEISGVVNEYYQADLTKEWPEIPHVKAIIHLAGLAAIGPSFDEPQKYINANTSMVTSIGEYYKKQDKKPRVVIVSSGSIYDPNQPMPINEKGEVGLFSPYAVSKTCNEHQAEYYCNRGQDWVVTRPFNHIGPGQGQGFLLPDLYNRLSSLKKGENKIITGNIETCRDYTDVRDIVRAYCIIALAKKLNRNVYNICSGKSLSGIEIFTELKNAMGLNGIKCEIDQSLIRPTDAKNIVGDNSRLKDELGWEPKIKIHQTIVDFVESKSKFKT